MIFAGAREMGGGVGVEPNTFAGGNVYLSLLLP